MFRFSKRAAQAKRKTKSSTPRTLQWRKSYNWFFLIPPLVLAGYLFSRVDQVLPIRSIQLAGTFENLDFKDAHFDRVFSMEALYYSADIDKAVSECFRVLKPGGSIETLVDYYEESKASASWDQALGLELLRLNESGWRDVFERAGFASVSTSRVIDSRGPSEAHSDDFGSRQELHKAGTLRISATKPD